MAASVSESLWSSSLKFLPRWNITKKFLIKQLWRGFKFFLFILIFSETNSMLRMQTLKSLLTSCFFFFFYPYKTFNSVNSPNFLAFVSFSNSGSIYRSYNLLFSKHHNTGRPQVLEFLEFCGIVLNFFWYWKCTWKRSLYPDCFGNVREFRSVL